MKVEASNRPNCDQILDLPQVRRQCVKLFGQETFDDTYMPTMSLLNTIKVPKNLLYLTDRLPKPVYELRAKSKKQT